MAYPLQFRSKIAVFVSSLGNKNRLDRVKFHLHALLHVRHIQKVIYIHSVKNARGKGAAYFPFVIGRCHFQRTSTTNGNR